jgi:hypothetical protein
MACGYMALIYGKRPNYLHSNNLWFSPNFRVFELLRQLFYVQINYQI